MVIFCLLTFRSRAAFLLARSSSRLPAPVPSHISPVALLPDVFPLPSLLLLPDDGLFFPAVFFPARGCSAARCSSSSCTWPAVRCRSTARYRPAAACRPSLCSFHLRLLSRRIIVITTHISVLLFSCHTPPPCSVQKRRSLRRSRPETRQPVHVRSQIILSHSSTFHTTLSRKVTAPHLTVM